MTLSHAEGMAADTDCRAAGVALPGSEPEQILPPAGEHPSVTSLAAGSLAVSSTERFRRLMREECGVELTLDEAQARASQLIGLYRMLMGPIPEDPGVRTSAHVPSQAGDTPGVLE
jgi:hypothetical protein